VHQETSFTSQTVGSLDARTRGQLKGGTEDGLFRAVTLGETLRCHEVAMARADAMSRGAAST